MIAQFVREVVKNLNETRQLRQIRRADPWLLQFNEAVAFFSRNGVPLNGVTTQRELNEALSGHLRFLQDPRTSGNPVLEAWIAQYLGVHSCPRS